MAKAVHVLNNLLFIFKILFADGKRILTTIELDEVTKKAFHKSKGAGVRTVHYNMKKYCGISERSIIKSVSELPAHQHLRKRFNNKAPIRPITASRVLERLQIDLVDKQSDTVKHRRKH